MAHSLQLTDGNLMRLKHYSDKELKVAGSARWHYTNLFNGTAHQIFGSSHLVLFTFFVPEIDAINGSENGRGGSNQIKAARKLMACTQVGANRMRFASAATSHDATTMQQRERSSR